MTFDHEHAFFAHEDPRWLICDCGQYAVRARNTQGMREVRMIDPPRPIFAPLVPRAPSDLRDCPQAKADAEAARAADAARSAMEQVEQVEQARARVGA